MINANLPNDGGVTGNPFFVLLNSTLKTQCEGIYKYIQKYYSLDELIVFSKKGPLEDGSKIILKNPARITGGIALALKYVELTDSFTVEQLTSHLDSNKNSLCIAGTLDENFGRRLTSQLARHPLSIIQLV